MLDFMGEAVDLGTRLKSAQMPAGTKQQLKQEVEQTQGPGGGVGVGLTVWRTVEMCLVTLAFHLLIFLMGPGAMLRC